MLNILRGMLCRYRVKSETKVFSFVVLYQAFTAVLVVGISALSFSSVSEIHFGSG